MELEEWSLEAAPLMAQHTCSFLEPGPCWSLSFFPAFPQPPCTLAASPPAGTLTEPLPPALVLLSTEPRVSGPVHPILRGQPNTGVGNTDAEEMNDCSSE